jgi:hypothetical protein
MAKGSGTKGKARDNGRGDTPAVIEGRLLDPFAEGGEIPGGAEPEETPTPAARRGSRRRSTAPAAEAPAMRAPTRRRSPRRAADAEPEGRAVAEAELSRCSVCGYVRRDPHDCPGPQS